MFNHHVDHALYSHFQCPYISMGKIDDRSRSTERSLEHLIRTKILFLVQEAQNYSVGIATTANGLISRVRIGSERVSETTAESAGCRLTRVATALIRDGLPARD